MSVAITAHTSQETHFLAVFRVLEMERATGFGPATFSLGRMMSSGGATVLFAT